MLLPSLLPASRRQRYADLEHFGLDPAVERFCEALLVGLPGWLKFNITSC